MVKGDTDVKRIFAVLIFMLAAACPAAAQARSDAREVAELEELWNDSIERQDSAQMGQFLADGYFLAVGVQGQPLRIVPRESWLESLKTYKIYSHSNEERK